MADQHQRQLDQYVRQQRIAHRHVDVLEPALAVEQRGKPPVRHAQHQERQQQRGTLLVDVDVLQRRADELEVRAHQPQHIRQQEQRQERVRRRQRTALLMAQVPEAVEGVEDDIGAILERRQVALPALPAARPIRT